MVFPLCKWYKFEKRWADVFQIYPNAIHLNPLQFCPSMPLLSFPVFCLSSSIVLNRYFHILVNSMTIWSVLKLPKLAWPSPFDANSGENKTNTMHLLRILSLIMLSPPSLWSVKRKKKGHCYQRIGGFYITWLKFKLQNYWSSWDFTFIMCKSSWKLMFLQLLAPNGFLVLW